MPIANHPIANLYLARALDPLIYVAGVIARDFFERPQHYTEVPDDVTDILDHLRSSLGYHPQWPNPPQRNMVAGRIVNRFAGEFAGIRRLAIQYEKRTADSGEAMARRAFKEDLKLVRSKIQPLEGVGLSKVAQIHAELLANASTVLQSKAVSDAFGVQKAPEGDWPDGGIFNPQLAYLCESISQTLRPDQAIRQPKISVLQRAGHYGAATIDGIVDESKAATDERFPDIVHNATAWAAALGALISSIHVARVWNEPEYRRGLVNLERDLMPPHPSGEIDLEGTVKTATPGFPGSLVFLLGTFATPMTITVDGEICCSTGDLSCDLTSSNNCQGSDDCPTQTHDCEFA